MITTVHPALNSRVYHKEIKAAVEGGFAVSMVVHDPPTNVDTEVSFRSLGQENSRIHRWSHLPRAYKLARKIDADIYHFHDPELLPVGVLLQRQTDASVIYDAHEDYGYNALEFRDWIPSPIRPAIAKSFPVIQSALANRLDTVITTSESIAQQFRDLGHERVEVIHNYPRTKDIAIGDPPELPTSDISLVYVGSLDQMRGLLPMLKLVRELVDRNEDVKLWLLGTFSNKQNEESAKEFIEKHNIENNVQLFGHVPYEDIFSYLEASDIGLCLVDEKRFEHAIPTKIFEYMYASTPVLATDATGTRSFITEETGQFVSQSNVNIQADIIQNLNSDRERLDNMGEKARKKVVEEYNWEQEAEKLTSIYKSLL
ncbi:glycosyltransferase family 4 protein [Natronorubrum sp. FCH18a]|uniref:glycosyltransferase family 4 protein n=1 Tax=Natronorubrum sp. FCH18a TaxID=3447018 RepID=UPI003F515601